MSKITAAKAIEVLTALAPCPIIHSVWELPKSDPRYGRNSRSCYYPKRTGKWAREQDFILMNRGEARSWRYVCTLAHEVGHALDHHGSHPAQKVLRSPRNRYRQELAAVSFEIKVMQQLGRYRTKLGKRWRQRSEQYLHRYTAGNHPSLAQVLRVIPPNPLEGI